MLEKNPVDLQIKISESWLAFLCFFDSLFFYFFLFSFTPFIHHAFTNKQLLSCSTQISARLLFDGYVLSTGVIIVRYMNACHTVSIRSIGFLAIHLVILIHVCVIWQLFRSMILWSSQALSIINTKAKK